MPLIPGMKRQSQVTTSGAMTLGNADPGSCGQKAWRDEEVTKGQKTGHEQGPLGNQAEVSGSNRRTPTFQPLLTLVSILHPTAIQCLPEEHCGATTQPILAGKGGVL